MQFLWILYIKEGNVALIPSWVNKQQHLFVTSVPLVNFHMIEWHTTDRVLRQFDCMQPIPDPSVDFLKSTRQIKKGQDVVNWANQHAPYIILWSIRHVRRPFVCSRDMVLFYVRVHMANGMPYLFQGCYMVVLKHAQPEYSQWQWTNTQSHRNRVPPFGNIEFVSNSDLVPQFEASGLSSDTAHP